MTTAIIKLDHLQKNLGKFAALKDVNFTLAPGQVLGFLGPNGAGKSTTIRVILDLLRRSGDSVTVLGRDAWRDDAAVHSCIAYVPEDVYSWPNLSGNEIISLLLRLNGRQRSQKTDELIKVFKSNLRKKARTYSKGNCQKVALTVALSQDADLYIFDEPASGFGPLNEQTFQQEVLELKRAGKSAPLPSRILSEVERVCDSIVIICDDSVVENGNLDRLRYLSRIKVEVTTAAPMIALAEQAGVHDLTHRGSEHTKAVFTADRDALGTIMTTLIADTVVGMQSAPPTLEDLLLRYYGKQGETHTA